MRDDLLTWFAGHRRDLPWRRAEARADPYRVLVAEVMLQQTRVDTAAPYYRRWLARFPDVGSLAAAGQDEVLLLWQGLGYYRRALRLHAAARALLERHGGSVPAARAALEALPGVGRYTSAAVRALAFGERAVAVDGNVRRLAARLFGWQEPPADDEIEGALLAALDRGTDAGGEAGPRRHGDAAEALLELGALVCTPRRPACDRCPLASTCRAAASGDPERFPAARPRAPAPSRRRWALVAIDGGRVWLRRRAVDEMLGGLWGFPQTDRPPEGARLLPSVRHAYSHFRLELVPAVLSPPGRARAEAAGATPRELAALPELALSAVDKLVLARLAEHALLPDPALS